MISKRTMAAIIILGSFTLVSVSMTPIADEFPKAILINTDTDPYFPPEGPIYFQKGLKLLCSAEWFHPVVILKWSWLRDGDIFIENDPNSSDRNNTSSSVIALDRRLANESVYTCEAVPASNHASWRKGRADFTVVEQPPIVSPPQEDADMIMLLSLICILLVVACLLVIFLRRGFQEGQKLLCDWNSWLDRGSSSSQSTEIKWTRLKYVGPLGEGHYGKVDLMRLDVDHAIWILRVMNRMSMSCTGRTLFQASVPVAVKSPKLAKVWSPAKIESILLEFRDNEIGMMKHLGSHPNLVGYLGEVNTIMGEDWNVYLVLEFCVGGNIRDYLIKKKGDFVNDLEERIQEDSRSTFPPVPMLLTHLLKWAEEIAAGMEYLASRRVAHIDLSARNVLVAHPNPELNPPDQSNHNPGELVVKIADFGLSRIVPEDGPSCYQLDREEGPHGERLQKRPLPIRWLSLDALTTMKATLKNDVWGMGVTFWEVFSLGDFPYHPDLNSSADRDDMIEYLVSGGRLPRPQHATDNMWSIMERCWTTDPDQRPTPAVIRLELKEYNERLRNGCADQTQPPALNSY